MDKNTYIIKKLPDLINLAQHCIEVNEEINNIDVILDLGVLYCNCCESANIVKNGTHRGRQRYRCKECGLTFGTTKSSFFYHSRLDANKLLLFLICYFRNETIKETAKKVGISKTGCFNLRVRFENELFNVY